MREKNMNNEELELKYLEYLEAPENLSAEEKAQVEDFIADMDRLMTSDHSPEPSAAMDSAILSFAKANQKTQKKAPILFTWIAIAAGAAACFLIGYTMIGGDTVTPDTPKEIVKDNPAEKKIDKKEIEKLVDEISDEEFLNASVDAEMDSLEEDMIALEAELELGLDF